MKKALEILPLFLLTIPLFIILHIEKDLQGIIPYKLMMQDIVELLIAPFFVVGIVYIFVKDFRKACILSLPLILVFYFFGVTKDSLQILDHRAFWSSYSFLLPIIAFLLILTLWQIRRSRSDFRTLFLYINTTFLFFISLDLIILFFQPVLKPGHTDLKGLHVKSYAVCDSCSHPDIYYLVFDAYTSSATLRSEFNFNNKPLENFLGEKGFFIVNNSASNYNLTPFSIASTLNADYIDNLNVEKDFYLKDYLPGVSLVYDNNLIPILRQEGYEIYNHSIFNLKHSNSTIREFDIWEVNLLYKRHNILRKINRDIGWILPSRFRIGNEVVNYAFERDDHVKHVIQEILKTVTLTSARPKFVYGHLLIPHDPYTFDSTGNRIPTAANELSFSDKKNAYIQQLIYTNGILKELVENISAHTKRPFIVLLQGDHGFRLKDKTKQKLDFANLNAIYFSNKDYRLLHENMSNVNTFRVIFNSFFKKNYPLLKDTSYFLHYK